MHSSLQLQRSPASIPTTARVRLNMATWGAPLSAGLIGVDAAERRGSSPGRGQAGPALDGERPRGPPCPVQSASVATAGQLVCSVCRDGDVRLAVLVGSSGPEPLGAAQDGVLHQRCKAPAAPLTNWPETELTERRGASGLVVASLSRSGIADLQPAAARPQILVSRHFGGRISAGPG